MYQENKSKTNLFKLGLCVIIAILVVLLSIKLVSIIIDRSNTKSTNKYMTTQLEKLNDVAKKYYVGDMLPKESGATTKTSLNDLIKGKVIEEVKDKNGNTCDMKESYISVTKLDKEYQYKSYLVCGEDTNYLNSFEAIKEDKTTTTTTTKKVTTTKATTVTTTTKAVTTTTTTRVNPYKGLYEVSFNVNGGKIINSQYLKYGEKVNYITPTRDGYRFLGWFYHGEEFDFRTPVTNDIVLTAKWALN